MKFFKILLLTVCALLITSLVTIVAAYKFIDDSTIKNQALATIQNTLNRQVVIDGEFSVSRTLHPTLNTTGVRIASAKWDQQNQLIEAEQFQIGLSLLDLLRGQVTIQNVKLVDTEINFMINPDGENNWTLQSSNKTNDASGSAPNIDVIDIELTNVQVNYIDQGNDSKNTFHIDEFVLQPKSETSTHLIVSSNIDQRPLKLEADICRIRHLFAGDNCQLNLNLDSFSFAANANGEIVLSETPRANQINIKVSGENVNDFFADTESNIPDTKNIELTAELNGLFEQLQLNNLNGQLAIEDTQIGIKGSIKSINTLDQVILDTEVKGAKPTWLNQYQEAFPAEIIDSFSIQASINNHDLWQVNLVESQLTIEDSKVSASGDLTFDADIPTTALNVFVEGSKPNWLNNFQEYIVPDEIDKFKVTALIKHADASWTVDDIDANILVDDNSITTQGTITLPEDTDPNISLSAASKGTNLKDLENFIQQTLPETKAYAANTDIQLEGSKLTLTQLAISIDDTKLSGKSTIDITKSPNINATINAESIDIDHLLTLSESFNEETEKAATKNDNSSEQSSLFSEEPLPLDWLKTANSEVALNIDELIFKAAKIKNIKSKITAKNNIAELKIDSLRYKDSDLNASAYLNGDNHQATLKILTESLDIGQWLAEAELSNAFKGKLDASVDLNSSGTSSQQISQNLTGNTTLIVTQGSLKDAPIDLLASNLLVAALPGGKKSEPTKLECLFVQLTGEQGLFTTTAAMLNTENIVMTVSGDVDLRKEQLDLLLVPKPKDLELFTLDSNIKVAGNLSDPSFSVDKSSLFKKLLKSAATLALGPAAMAIPFTNLGSSKHEKCFTEVANTTSDAVKAQQEAERLAQEAAEKAAADAETETTEPESDKIKEATVEPLNLE